MTTQPTELDKPVTGEPLQANPGPGAKQKPLMIEAGAVFMHVAGFDAGAMTESAAVSGRNEKPARAARPEHFDVVVIGAGQAGLSVGHHLATKGLRFVILDAARRVGDQWRERWDSLHLFTPRHLDGLDGMRFPGRADTFPSKDEMADYLEAYAKRFDLPIRSGVKVDRLWQDHGQFRIAAGEHHFVAEQVVVAIGTYQKPRVPAFAGELAPHIVQLHSSAYRNPAQLAPGAVLIAGAGNSGAEIAIETVRSHETWLSGRATGAVPFNIRGWLGRTLLCRLLLRLVFHRLLTVDRAAGRKARHKMLSQGGALIRTKLPQLSAAGVKHVTRVAGAREGLPVLQDGRKLEVANVIWCTGFEPGFSWIDLPIFDEHHEPVHHSGVVAPAPGLYFVGLHFLHAMSSGMIHGVGRDAARIVDRIVKHCQVA